jgi:hypothetical protein
VAVDLATNQVVKTIVLPPRVALSTTYLTMFVFDQAERLVEDSHRTESSGGLVNGSICTTARENPRKSDGDAVAARPIPGLNRQDNPLGRGGLAASFQKR